jgi:hypothetical protein
LEKEGYEEFASQFEGKIMQYLPKLKRICTMKSTTEFCGIETRHGYKYPKLEELYNKLFDEDIDRQHDAKDDVFITAKCFWRLKDLGLMETNGENSEDEFHSENENFETVKIIRVTMTGEIEGYVHYKKYRNDNFVSDGIAFCDDVDEVEVSEEDCLTRNSRLSQDGLNILSLNGENWEDEFSSESEDFETIKIIKVTMAGDKEGYVHYKKYRNGNFISDGIAFCDDVDEVELEEDCLSRNSWLSQDGLSILHL